MKTAYCVTITLFATACFHAFYRYEALPAWVASNFGAGGQPQGWMSRPTFVAVLLGTQLVLVLTFVLIPRLLMRMPWTLNVPHREYWLAPERRVETLALVGRQLAWCGAGTQLFFLLVQSEVFTANIERTSLSGRFLVFFIIYMAGMTLWTVWFVRHFWRTPHSVAKTR